MGKREMARIHSSTEGDARLKVFLSGHGNTYSGQGSGDALYLYLSKCRETYIPIYGYGI